MDNTQFIIELSKLQDNYLAKVKETGEGIQEDLATKFAAGMEVVFKEAQEKLRITMTQADAGLDRVVKKSASSFEAIAGQAQRLEADTRMVLLAAQRSTANVAALETQLCERLASVSAVVQEQGHRLQQVVQIDGEAIRQDLRGRQAEAKEVLTVLKQSVDKASWDAACILRDSVKIWSNLVRWVTVPIFAASVLGGLLAVGWAARTYGEQEGYDQARSIARDQLKEDLDVSVWAVQPKYDPTTGGVTALDPVQMVKPIVIVNGEPHWLGHDNQGWVYGGVRLNPDWTMADVVDVKDKKGKLLASRRAGR